jgi:cell division protein FtsZ
LDNDNIISMVETVPTFQRSKDMLDSIQTRISTEDEFHHTENSENENGNVIHF